MAKSSNPVDAHRKAQRAKELKKNKQNRTKAKEISTVKKDTRPLEQDIRRLSAKANLSKQDKDELASLRAEVARINKAKHEYVEAHPEHRKFVFPERPAEPADAQGADEPAGLYDRNGRLKHPERSIYYDPVFNPFGAPPPGMPYREKPEYTMQRLGIPTPEELAAFTPVARGSAILASTDHLWQTHTLLPPTASDGEEDDDDESESDGDDIAMPAGPPPAGKAGSDSDSDDDSDDDDDDIPLPPGPPPPQAAAASSQSSRVFIARPSRPAPSSPGYRTHGGPTPHALPPRPAFLPPPPPSLPPPPNAPTGPRYPHQLPSRPPLPPQHMSDPMSLGNSDPQRAYQQGFSAAPSIGPIHPPSTSSSATISAGPSPFLLIGQPHGASAAASSATISAAPQLRDLKKEATAFLPAAMRKKQQQAKAKLDRVGLSKVNARGGDGANAGPEQAHESPIEKGPSLMESLKARGVGGASGLAQTLPPPQDQDYKKFEEDLKDFL
ncbi:uncharacterized protein JCM15063_004245 [Sporobolomyces koalae]|uniref:uncharacterized protein n=1 Tax=Sporobolomyces koalae TaxID=500713 RepID=UPI00317773D9